MDAGRLKESCICGNTEPYLVCCGRFAAPDPSGEGAERLWAGFRHALHELYMYLFTFRNLYQDYWKRLEGEGGAQQRLMEVPAYGRAVVANFFWDYSQQFSDARPILRAARDMDGKNLRMANDFRQWGLAPLWIYRVTGKEAAQAVLGMLGTGKSFRAAHARMLSPVGTFVAARILPYRGAWFLHPALLVFPKGTDGAAAETRLGEICAALGVKSGAALRPDIQCEAWRDHGGRFLAWWRELALDSVAGKSPREKVSMPVSGDDWDAWIQSSLPELNGQTPVQASNHDFGRRKLRQLLGDLSSMGRDVSGAKRRLGV